jgi:hypothetical protein
MDATRARKPLFLSGSEALHRAHPSQSPCPSVENSRSLCRKPYAHAGGQGLDPGYRYGIISDNLYPGGAFGICMPQPDRGYRVDHDSVAE